MARDCNCYLCRKNKPRVLTRESWLARLEREAKLRIEHEKVQTKKTRSAETSCK